LPLSVLSTGRIAFEPENPVLSPRDSQDPPDESVRIAAQAIGQAGAEQADIICFPECYEPGS